MGREEEIKSHWARHATSTTVLGVPSSRSGSSPSSSGTGGGIDPNAYTGAQLREMAENLGLPVSGTKAQVAARIDAAQRA